MRNLTDLGNAERFVDQNGDRVRYCHERDEWLVWDGRRWAEWLRRIRRVPGFAG